MLTVTEGLLSAFQMEARRSLRSLLLAHWSDRLRGTGNIIGATGREQVLQAIETLAEQDRTLDLADLMMAADLMLIEVANELRETRATRLH